ncbi:alpha/beta fold hydrolase [Alteraurantiacibacter buctensis]|uniref:Alpha/beta fold hydrolase n=1 Tax=Alteraurantiacibacter buctensis TaxID=1503981 RepID=A0A844Z1H2_9SPHN|nr:alpha/beta fold hydrolase [Alteraurantiacibacter buctensis]
MSSAFMTVGSARLEFARWGGGVGLPILLLHEGLGSIKLWKEFPAMLASATGREVVAWSRMGHGWSDPDTTRREPDYMHREAALLSDVMDALGMERAHWFGHSDGASIALIGANMHPGRVASLTLEAPHVLVEDLTHSSIAEVAARFPQTDMGERMKRYHADPIALFDDWSAIWLDPRFRDWNIEGLLGGISAPALLIHGHDDQYGTLDQLDRIAAVLADTTRVELPDCRHSPHLDQQDAVIAAVCGFLNDKD